MKASEVGPPTHYLLHHYYITITVQVFSVSRCSVSPGVQSLCLQVFSVSRCSVCVCFQVFRTDLITAMKVHDSQSLSPEDFYVLADPWRQDWEKGVQVPVTPHSLPQPIAR